MKNTAFLFILFFIYCPAALGTLYDMLGVSCNCTQEEIEQGYKRMRGAFHPDRNKASDATRTFQEIKEAYDILRNPTLRTQYNNQIRTEKYRQEFKNESNKATSKTRDDNVREEQVIGDTELHIAIKRDRRRYGEFYDQHEGKVIQMIQVLLEEEVNLDAQNSRKETSLALAIQRVLPKVINFLLDKGADPGISDQNGNNALHALILSGKEYYCEPPQQRQKRIVSLAKSMIEKSKETNLLTARNNKQQLPLHLAVLHDLPKVAELIIKQNGTENLKKEERSLLIQEAIQREHIEVVRLLRKNVTKETNSSDQPVAANTKSNNNMKADQAIENTQFHLSIKNNYKESYDQTENRFLNVLNTFCQTIFSWKKAEQ